MTTAINPPKFPACLHVREFEERFPGAFSANLTDCMRSYLPFHANILFSDERRGLSSSAGPSRPHGVDLRCFAVNEHSDIACEVLIGFTQHNTL